MINRIVSAVGQGLRQTSEARGQPISTGVRVEPLDEEQMEVQGGCHPAALGLAPRRSPA